MHPAFLHINKVAEVTIATRVVSRYKFYAATGVHGEFAVRLVVSVTFQVSA